MIASMPTINPRRKRATENPDHARRYHDTPAPADAEIERRLNDLVLPAAYAEMDYYRRLGLRNRLLNLPVMVAIVLAMLWRHIPGVCALQKLLARERVLWTRPMSVTQASLSERFLIFPAELFERVLYRVLARLPERIARRTRPLPPALATVVPRFAHLYACDGTTLEALFRKLDALQDQADAPLAGKLLAVVDLVTHLPAKLWYVEDPATNDKALSDQILAWLPAQSLLVFDLGFFAFPFFDALGAAGHAFVTRLRAKTSYRVEQVLLELPTVRDRIIHLGLYRSNPSERPVRLIEVQFNGTWYSYLTNVLDPQRLNVLEVVQLYDYRWHIETAFLLVKRLLDLAYLWVGSLNGVQLQVWATWLYYAILIDLCDDVAEQLQLPLERISVEMVARGLYFYVGAQAHGYTGAAAQYFAAPENQDLGIVKRRDPRSKRPAQLAELRQVLREAGVIPQAVPVEGPSPAPPAPPLTAPGFR
jgi:hypothetical protein